MLLSHRNGYRGCKLLIKYVKHTHLIRDCPFITAEFCTFWMLLVALTPVSSVLRLRDHDRRLHVFHQRVNLHRQLSAHQPPHRVRPAQPLQLLRPEDWGFDRGHGQNKLLFSINMSSKKKKKILSVFFANFWSSPSYCWEREDLVGWGVCLGGLKENTGVLFFYS